MFSHTRFNPRVDGLNLSLEKKAEIQSETVLKAYRTALDRGSVAVALELRVSNPELDSEFDKIVIRHGKPEPTNAEQKQALRALSVVAGVFLAGVWIWIAALGCSPFAC